jgi:stage V sporulation protein R
MATGRTPLFEGSEWTYDLLKRAYDAIEEIAVEDLGLDLYRNQIEVITAEQMLDAYSSIGMPLMYKHWSFGKHFSRDEMMYRKGYTGLAYEIVINSNPCISYNMEENTMTLQTLVMAHAAFGHNHFFKNNYLFRQWTDAEGILTYMAFAKDYIAKCEERYGLSDVERTLDAAHALMSHGVDRRTRPRKVSLEAEMERQRRRARYAEQTYDDLWRTVPRQGGERQMLSSSAEAGDALTELPEENLLYFLEKNAPNLETWQREILRIVRNVAQYFFPQKQTKVMNEGTATFTHYYIMNALYDRGLLTDGAMLEFIDHHSTVVTQPAFDHPRYPGINPYALGFAMMRDIKRAVEDPDEEDKATLPDIAGAGDWRAVLKDIWANFRDESFILQYLSPKVIRDFHLFDIHDDASQPHMRVEAIHDERGFRRLKRNLAKLYDINYREPDLQIVEANLKGGRQLRVKHTVHDEVPLDTSEAKATLGHLAYLWGYDVLLTGEDRETGRTLYTLSADG